MICCDQACEDTQCHSCNLTLNTQQGPVSYWTGQCVPLPYGDQGGCGGGQACDGNQQCVDGAANGTTCDPGNHTCVSGSCVGQSTKRCRPANQDADVPCTSDGACKNGCEMTSHLCN